jgi:hypothetical protein
LNFPRKPIYKTFDIKAKMFLCLVSVAVDKPRFDEYFDQQKVAAEEFGSQPNTSTLLNGIRRAEAYLLHGVHTKPRLTPFVSV